ncbi:MAG: hypothetical protein JSS83_08150 [Cyanobacteria bacterium SZAS LIN-3]|nr:hypothetical protein [Cyanobacteria bacterium SZAS LIN-3]
MGSSMSWFASRKTVPKEVMDEISRGFKQERSEFMERMAALNPTFAKGPMARLREAGVVADRHLPSGWHAVYVERGDVIQANSAQMAKLSIGTTVVACFIEEHVMYSSAAQWDNGKLSWMVIHDSQKGRLNMQTTGKLPPQYQKIYEGLKAKQVSLDDCDYLFDVPPEVAHAVTGIRIF